MKEMGWATNGGENTPLLGWTLSTYPTGTIKLDAKGDGLPKRLSLIAHVRFHFQGCWINSFTCCLLAPSHLIQITWLVLKTPAGLDGYRLIWIRCVRSREAGWGNSTTLDDCNLSYQISIRHIQRVWRKCSLCKLWEKVLMTLNESHCVIA